MIVLVRPGGKIPNFESAELNELFDTLADWEEQLKHANIDFDAPPYCDPESDSKSEAPGQEGPGL